MRPPAASTIFTIVTIFPGAFSGSHRSAFPLSLLVLNRCPLTFPAGPSLSSCTPHWSSAQVAGTCLRVSVAIHCVIKVQQSQGLLPPGTQFDVFRGVAGDCRSYCLRCCYCCSYYRPAQLPAPTLRIFFAPKPPKSYVSAQKLSPPALCSRPTDNSSCLAAPTDSLRYRDSNQHSARALSLAS